MYAAGQPHANKAACVKLLKKIAVGQELHHFCTDTEVLQEIFHRYLSLRRFEVGSAVLDTILNLKLRVLPIELEDLITSRAILARHSKLSARDALHAAVVERNELEAIMSYDRDFDKIDGIKRVIPRA